MTLITYPQYSNFARTQRHNRFKRPGPGKDVIEDMFAGFFKFRDKAKHVASI